MSIMLFDPGDSAIITFDWTDVLPASVTVASATHTVDSPLSKVSESYTTTTSMVKVTGAVHGSHYQVVGVATLSNGEVISRGESVVCMR